MPKDRADAVAAIIAGAVRRWVGEDALRGEIVAVLREEFNDLRREILSDFSPDPTD